MGPFSLFRWLLKTFLELFAIGGFFIHRGYGSAGCLVALVWLPGAMCMFAAFIPLPTVQQFMRQRLGFFIVGFILIMMAGALNTKLRHQTQKPHSFGGRHPPGGSP